MATKESIERMDTSEILDAIHKQHKAGKELDKETIEGLLSREPFRSYSAELSNLSEEIKLLKVQFKKHQHSVTNGEPMAPI